MDNQQTQTNQQNNQQTNNQEQNQNDNNICKRLGIIKSEMQKPHIAKPFPYSKKLIKGQEYLYCVCGLSADQPFCDYECRGTKFEPLKFIAKDQAIAMICGCKRNNPKAGPYCDGSHSNLDW